MKAKEAPEKIYLEKVYPDNGVLPNGLNYNQSPNDIEYTRTDAFIEKACNKLAQLMYDQQLFEGRLHQDAIIENFVGDFRNYMKGE